MSIRRSRYFVIIAVAWMAALTWRIYPQFRDTLRIEGRLMTLDAYVEESCGQRIGPAAASCLAEARDTGQRLVAREQGKFILIILAPVLIYLPACLAMAVFDRRRNRPIGQETMTR